MNKYQKNTPGTAAQNAKTQKEGKKTTDYSRFSCE